MSKVYRRNRTKTAIACGIAALVAGTANAQEGETEQGEGVRDRARPDYDAAGLRVGAFQAYPSAVVSFDYNDNIFAVSTPEQDDVVLAIEPNLYIQSNWSRHEVSAEVGGRIERFLDIEDENSAEYFGKVKGGLDIGGDSEITGAAYFGHLVDSRTNNSFDAGNSVLLTAEPITYDLVQTDIGFSHVINRIRLSGAARYSAYDFDDQPLVGGGVSDQDVRDHDAFKYLGQADWAISPDTSLFVRGAIKRWEYDLAPPNAAFDRDSEGYEIAGGADFKLGNLAAGKIFIGYQEQSFDDDPRLSNVEAIDYGAAVHWYMSELTTVSVDVESDIKPSTIASASSFIRQDVQVTVDHELMRNVLVQGRAWYGRDKFDDIARRDEWFAGGVRVDYLLNRKMRFFTSFDYVDQTSDAPINSFDQKIVIIGSTFQM